MSLRSEWKSLRLALLLLAVSYVLFCFLKDRKVLIKSFKSYYVKICKVSTCAYVIYSCNRIISLLHQWFCYLKGLHVYDWDFDDFCQNCSEVLNV